jgi:hypothetical protein
MISSDLNNAGDNQANGRWEGTAGPILVEVKRTNSMRDVRGALLALAYLVDGESSKSQAVCVVVDSRLSQARLGEELNRLRGVLRPELADRIHFLANRGAQSHGPTAFSGSLEAVPSAFYEWLEGLITTERLRGHAPKLPQRQIVVATLAQLRLWNQPPVTVKRLQETSGASYPTVATVLKELGEKGWLENSSERGVRLRHLTIGEWMDLARDHARLRKAHLFTDPTGHATPEQMAKRLAQLQDASKLPRNVRIGGVLGASRHFPELDITAAPRLDLSASADPTHVAEMIDAGLRPKTRPEQRVALAVHATRDPWVITNAGSQPLERWAGELECLADLIEMGFTREASEMAHHMELTNKEGRSTP